MTSNRIPSYENLTGVSTSNYLAKAEELFANGWSRREYPYIPLGGAFPWDIRDQELRSWSFYIHSLDMIDPLLMAFDRSRETRFLEPALKIGLDWATKHPRDRNDLPPMAWYDMAVGMRAYRLAYLYQVADAKGLLMPQMRATLERALEDHRAELADDNKIVFHNNHGYYQIAGQLALGRRMGYMSQAMQALYDQGAERFSRILDQQFSSENVHREHSPDYHRMVLSTLQGIVRSGLVQNPALRARARKIEEMLAWFILPSGVIVNFGDSDSRSMRASATAAAEKWDTDLMRGSVIARPEDLPRPDGLMVLPESGYAIIRTPGPKAGDPSQDSYLAQTAAFHSRTHKHADDLSFVWFERGEPLLVDAGRYGYIGKAEQGSEPWLDGSWYTDPMRLFVESTRAHNVLEFDGRNYPRRGVKPYGSAIGSAVKVDGTYAIETAVKQFGQIRHDRVLILRPNQWLIVFDVFNDNLKEPHDVIQWFHVASGTEVERENDAFLLRTGGGHRLKAISLMPEPDPIDVQTGVTEPRLQGWWSGKEREALKAPAFGFSRSQTESGIFATMFGFDGQLEPDVEMTRSNVTGRRFRLGWRDAEGQKSIEIHREDGLQILK